jgi:hypothetical protein
MKDRNDKVKIGICRDCDNERELPRNQRRCQECLDARIRELQRIRGPIYKQTRPDQVNKGEVQAQRKPERKAARIQQREAWKTRNPEKVQAITQRQTEKRRRLIVEIETDLAIYFETEEGQELLRRCKEGQG